MRAKLQIPNYKCQTANSKQQMPTYKNGLSGVRRSLSDARVGASSQRWWQGISIYVKTISWRNTNGASALCASAVMTSRSCPGTPAIVTLAMLP